MEKSTTTGVLAVIILQEWLLVRDYMGLMSARIQKSRDMTGGRGHRFLLISNSVHCLRDIGGRLARDRHVT
jgi:hypothetical protein